MQINAEYINYEIIAEQNIQIIDTSTVLHFLFPFDFSDNSPLYDRLPRQQKKKKWKDSSQNLRKLLDLLSITRFTDFLNYFLASRCYVTITA